MSPEIIETGERPLTGGDRLDETKEEIVEPSIEEIYSSWRELVGLSTDPFPPSFAEHPGNLLAQKGICEDPFGLYDRDGVNREINELIVGELGSGKTTFTLLLTCACRNERGHKTFPISLSGSRLIPEEYSLPSDEESVLSMVRISVGEELLLRLFDQPQKYIDLESNEREIILGVIRALIPGDLTYRLVPLRDVLREQDVTAREAVEALSEINPGAVDIRRSLGKHSHWLEIVSDLMRGDIQPRSIDDFDAFKEASRTVFELLGFERVVILIDDAEGFGSDGSLVEKMNLIETAFQEFPVSFKVFASESLNEQLSGKVEWGRVVTLDWSHQDLVDLVNGRVFHATSGEGPFSSLKGKGFASSVEEIIEELNISTPREAVDFFGQFLQITARRWCQNQDTTPKITREDFLKAEARFSQML